MPQDQVIRHLGWTKMDALHFRDVYFCDVSAPIWGASLGAALVAAPPQAGNQLTAVSTPRPACWTVDCLPLVQPQVGC